MRSSRNAPLLFKNLEMLHFFYFLVQMRKWCISKFSNIKLGGGLFEKKARDRFEIENKIKNKYDRFWGSSKRINAITCKINPSHTFLGHFKWPPVFKSTIFHPESVFMRLNSEYQLPSNFPAITETISTDLWFLNSSKTF